MAVVQRKKIGDCSELPFSRERADAIRDGLPPDKLVKRLFDPSKPGELPLRELAGSPILTWPILVPSRDARGVRTGSDFECWKKPQDSKLGIASYQFCLKRQGVLNCHSGLEARLLAFFDFCPFVLEVRTQYPSWCRDEYSRYRDEGRRFPKNKVMSIDFLLTLQIPGIPYPVYHGVSAKPFSMLEMKNVKRRHAKEISRLFSWSASHEVMHELTVPDSEYGNYLFLNSLMVHVDIERCWIEAHQFATDLMSSTAVGSMDRILGMLGNRRGYSLDDSYRLFAVAIFLGYLVVDHTFPLDVDESLNLVGRDIARKALPSYLLVDESSGF
ncbi:hypothetical protein P0D68_03125 [Paraburkholderia sp. RL17-380-BIE-A]|uniref:hypothetical protein n=1 Tax=Paraburkholderia sp. RL17-380-BIE-A TaxID=3031630 RepID=UPI0038BDDD48